MDATAFFVFGLAFFLLIAYVIITDERRVNERNNKRDDELYGRRLNEAREFGYQGEKHNVRTLNDKWK